MKLGRSAALLLSLLAVAAGSTWAQPTERNTFGLFGNVKRVDERSVEVQVVNGVRKEGKSSSETTIVFDGKGRLEYEAYGRETKVERRHVYSGDGVRRTITDTRLPFEASNTRKRPSVSGARFSYDASDNSISHDTLSGRDLGGPVVQLNEYGNRYKYFFDSSNRLTKQVFMDASLNELTTYNYTYAGSGPPTEARLSLRGRLLQTILYKYELDASGNWTRRESQSIPSDPRHPITFDVGYRKISYYKD